MDLGKIIEEKNCKVRQKEYIPFRIGILNLELKNEYFWKLFFVEDMICRTNLFSGIIEIVSMYVL